ncbi:fibulin-1-like [Uloborus diversus]|uniref:fibulin-1-like n=1 Tax=Uloborus diversus TaxID=327109 RepID=UPI00240A6B7A|nr:fibulin-1-like [Uloborus diversus]
MNTEKYERIMSFFLLFVFFSAILREVAADSFGCELPNAIENGKIREFYVKGRKHFLVTCLPSYNLDGLRMGRCINDKWNVQFPRCNKNQENLCKNLKPPVYGKKSCSNGVAHIGSSCSFECSKSYVLKGSRERICQGNLEWSGKETYCVPKTVDDYGRAIGRLHPCLNSRCEQRCQTTENGYKCSCEPGYELIDDHKCKDIDECANKDSNSCQQFCHNTPGSFKCSCLPGFVLTDGTKCEDIDECAIEGKNPCQHFCHNTLGSFECSCSPGYILVYDTKCEGCRKNSYWSDEYNTCFECPRNSYTETNGKTSIFDCRCRSGFEGDPSRNIPCLDIDECAVQNFGCSDKCINTAGSAYCSCALGYELQSDNKTCSDINECEINNGGCQDKCLNSIGSYSCSCGSGYIVSKTNQYLCDDIDECAVENGGCSEICVNFPGGYFCSCKTGFRLNRTEKNCKAITCPNVPTPHFAQKRCKTGSNRLSNGKYYPVNTTCSFSCLKGFKENFRGVIQCEEDGQWSGIVPKCIALSCPPLEAPEHGNIHPKSCLKGISSVKEKCTYTCNPGYRLKYKTPVVRCRNNLTWSGSNESAICVRIKTDPFISCPNDIRVDLQPLENSTSVTVPEPDTDWKDLDVIPQWVSVGKPTIFPAGKTDVIFSIKNEHKKKISECILTVNVVDNDPPVFYQCPDSFEVKNASAYGVPVTWEEPVIFDNVGIKSIESNVRQNTTLAPGIHTVEYIARDEAGNIATCSFQINVTTNYCSDMEDPLNGKANCIDWMFGKMCEPTCNDGYWQDPEEQYYMCNESGIWHPRDFIKPCLKFYDLKNSTCEAGFQLLNTKEGSICIECPKGYTCNRDDVREKGN